MEGRNSEYPVQEWIISRHSPRAMSGEKLSHEELFSLFEAAKWAPSSYNGQPWRFIYAHRETEHFDRLYNLLIDFNQAWCKNAAALICILSKKSFEKNGKPCPTHSFDTGAAWENLALQAHAMNLVAHGMQGFDYEKAKIDLKVSEDFAVEAMAAVGRKAGSDVLPPEIKEKEGITSRKPVSEIVMEGVFG